MAGERVDGKVALRLFLLLVGVLFIWNSIPSHRWTKNVSNNIETGMWSTCSCVGVGFKDCNLEYTELEKQYFLVKANLTDKKQDPTKYKAQQDAYAQGQLLFPSGHQHQGANPSSKQPSVTARKNNNNNGKNNNTNNNNNKHNNNNNSDKNINKDSKQCTQYNGSGAIALISYIFAFIALLVIVKNIAGNVLPVLNGSVFGFVILSGIFGLIATCMFGDLYGSRLVPFGYHFGLFTTAWVLFLVVGLSGMSDLRKGGAASESTSAVRAGLLVLALTAFAFSMGNNWYVHNETLLAPLGGRNWTIKAGTFFIEPTNTLGFDSATSLDSIKDLVKPKDQKKPFWCDAEFQDYGKDTVAPATQSQSVAHDVGRKKNNNNDKGNSNKGNKNEHKHHSKDHSKDGCMTNPEVTEVKGFKEIGLYAGCYCKDTLSTQCSLFGSYEIMFDNRSYNCTIFQVSRAMVLMVGILALASMVLSSALLGGLRKVELHLLSNTLAFLAAVLGLISTILFGVLYSVDDLAQDFAIYLAGWWLVFFAAVLGGPVAGYYREVQSAGKVSPVELQ